MDRGETQKRWLCEGRGREWSEAATSQRPPRAARSHQKLKKTRTDSLLEP